MGSVTYEEVFMSNNEDENGKKTSDNVHKMYPSNSADNPDLVLEQAMGMYNEVLVLGWNTDDLLDAKCTNGMTDADILMMLEIFKKLLIEKNVDWNE